MSRPKNLNVLVGKTVVSAPPSVVKEYLRAAKAGTANGLPDAKVVGEVNLSLDAVTAENAEAAFQTLFGVPMTAPTPEPVTTSAPAVEQPRVVID